MDNIQERLDRFKQVPVDLYVTKEDLLIMKSGGEGIGYVSVPNKGEYELVYRLALQPAIQLSDNSYSITFIMK